MKPRKKRIGRQATAFSIQSKVNAAMGKPVLRLGSDPRFIPVKIPTGSLCVDRITGGGLTLGRHSELFGDYSAGKSYIMLRTMALAQQRGEICGLVDPEKVFDSTWFSHLGGYPGELLLFQPEKEWNAEDAVGVLMLLADLVDEEAISVLGIDSVASMVTQEEMKKDIREGDDRVATQARMMSRALRRITTMNRRTAFIWTNQERSNVGPLAIFNRNTQPGGRALGFYATTRIEFKKTGAVKAKGKVAEKGRLVEKDRKVGNWIQVRVEKEKSTMPYRQASFLFDSNAGRIDVSSEILHLGLEDEILLRNGNFITYETVDGEAISLTEKKFMQRVRSDEALREELVEGIQDRTAQLAKVGDEE